MKRAERFYRVMQFCYAVSCGCIGVYNFFYRQPASAILGFVGLLFLLVPALGERLLRVELGHGLKGMVLAFCFVAYNLGTALGLYQTVPMLDKAMHLLSGTLFTFIGLCLYARARKDKEPEEWFLQATYALFLSMSIAVFWEIYEYMLFASVGHDAQNHLTTGVVDTMQDMIACLFGSLFVAGAFALYSKKGIRLRIMAAYEQFVRDNI